jgi:hypothetical protein
MKKLLFTALIALSIISCTTKDSEIIKPNNQVGKAEGVISFTYNGISETIYNEAVFDENGFTRAEYYNDISKPWFAWKPHANTYRIYLGLGRDMRHEKTVQKRLFLIYAKKPNTNAIDDFNYYIYDVAIVLKNKKVTISSVDRKYISGTFSSDKITGKFENIRYNTLF